MKSKPTFSNHYGNGIDLRRAGTLYGASISVACVLLVMLVFPFAAPRVSLMVAIATALGCLALSLLLLKWASFWWPPASAFLALLLAYPLWSWRKLEATQRYLNEELSRLEHEPIIVPFDALSPSDNAARSTLLPGLIEQRIAVVKAATERLRTLNRFIAESIESLPDATIVSDPEGKVLLANSAAVRLFKARRTTPEKAGGRPPDQPLEGRDVIVLLEKFSRHGGGGDWRSAWLDAYDQTRLVSFEAQFEGSRDFLIQVGPLFSSRGTQNGTIVSLVDISPLRESERRRDEALRFLSHDMRSPQASTSIGSINGVAVCDGGGGCASGQAQGTVNGVTSCYPIGKITEKTTTQKAGETGTTTTTTPPTGPATTTGEVKTTTCTGDRCTTNTRTTGADGQVTNQTTTEDKGEYCARNPNNVLCKGTGTGTGSDTGEEPSDFCTNNPDSPMCKEVEPGTAAETGELYSERTDTVGGVMDSFRAQVSSSPIFSAVTNYFSGSIPSGSCAGLEVTVPVFTSSYH